MSEHNNGVEAEDAYWAQVDEMDLEGIAEVLFQDKESQASKTRERQKAAIVVSIIGIFLQSAHTPEKVINTLARMGISISSENALCKLGKTLLAVYAYDNFDVELKLCIPTVENPAESLKHLTSGLLFPLQYNITPQDLKCSQELWIKSSLNPTITTVNPRQKRTYKVIEQIPVVKTPIIAAQAMDINYSIISGNICAVVDLLAQGGLDVGNERKPEENDLEDYVVLFYGDLGMGERLQAVQEH
ncbi:hypothetical protein SERLA73DRAFT_150640 [Serpula lacrymans var. lacrymans S7.3]|uniref:DUF6589 domain-containing protein n=1 Tax=Serpula lacrymans var. lacrymans (strain S7.3) TaxID=936435 RepID=F8PPK1_SERL3|nr:hypothetical protein SERLA73DRAFT_150640 [Serpula lacrymans var. lacrymans S7.3]